MFLSLFISFLIVELESLPTNTAVCPANGNPSGKIDVFHLNVHINYLIFHYFKEKKLRFKVKWSKRNAGGRKITDSVWTWRLGNISSEQENQAEIKWFNKQKLFPYQKLSWERTGIFSNIFSCQGAALLAAS